MRRLDVDILFFFQYIMGKRDEMCIKWQSWLVANGFRPFSKPFVTLFVVPTAHANFGQTGNNRALITLKNEQWPQLVPLN